MGLHVDVLRRIVEEPNRWYAQELVYVLRCHPIAARTVLDGLEELGLIGRRAYYGVLPDGRHKGRPPMVAYPLPAGVRALEALGGRAGS